MWCYFLENVASPMSSDPSALILRHRHMLSDVLIICHSGLPVPVSWVYIEKCELTLLYPGTPSSGSAYVHPAFRILNLISFSCFFSLSGSCLIIPVYSFCYENGPLSRGRPGFNTPPTPGVSLMYSGPFFPHSSLKDTSNGIFDSRVHTVSQ